MAEEALPNIPNLRVAQLLFELQTTNNDKDQGEELLTLVKQDSMAPLYKQVCSVAGVEVDEDVLNDMNKANEENTTKLKNAIQDAEENEGEIEICDAVRAHAEHFCRIGDKEKALEHLRTLFEKSVSVGSRLDVIFTVLRIGFFFNDSDVIKQNIEKADALMDEGGDWERRNRLKVYKGFNCLRMREFSDCAKLFLETVSTFTCTELMSYNSFIGLTVLVSVLTLNRPELAKKVVKGPEIQQALHELPLHKAFLMSFYNGSYADFFQALAEVETLLKKDFVLSRHFQFFVRELRIKAYQQLLQSYRSLTTASMASSFGVSEAFIDHELSRFIAAGRLNCKLDKVDGIIETTRPDEKNAKYSDTIKKGDMLLNRLQKLSQAVVHT
eukprot:m.4943 g.4943  ORF g.4943 m.4943 type:complete len:384 (-) comp4063_c0_seq1:113-1264(-)